MVSSTSADNNLTVSSAASGNYALKVMTIVAVVIFPIVLAYQIWNFHVFRQRIASPPARHPPPPKQYRRQPDGVRRNDEAHGGDRGRRLCRRCCAKELAKHDIPVTLLDRHNYQQFQPLLYQVATAELGTTDVARPIRAIFAKDPTVRCDSSRSRMSTLTRRP